MWLLKTCIKETSPVVFKWTVGSQEFVDWRRSTSSAIFRYYRLQVKVSLISATSAFIEVDPSLAPEVLQRLAGHGSPYWHLRSFTEYQEQRDKFGCLDESLNHVQERDQEAISESLKENTLSVLTSMAEVKQKDRQQQERVEEKRTCAIM